MSKVVSALAVRCTLVLSALVLGACSFGDAEQNSAVDASQSSELVPTSQLAEELFPDVVSATAQLADDGSWTFSATISSLYDSPDRYADAWRVVGLDGTVYGIRELAHDHASEQPFTRSQSGIAIPLDVSEVTIEGRDQLSGWGGQTTAIILRR